MEGKIVRTHFPIALKAEVVQRYQAGEKVRVLMKLYNLKSDGTIYNWAKSEQVKAVVDKLAPYVTSTAVVVHSDKQAYIKELEDTLIKKENYIAELEQRLEHTSNTESILQTITMTLGEKIRDK